MGHANRSITLGIYAHLFNTDDHADAMAALGAMVATPKECRAAAWLIGLFVAGSLVLDEPSIGRDRDCAAT